MRFNITTSINIEFPHSIYFSLPKSVDIAKQWKIATGVGINGSRGPICANHFRDCDFTRKDKSRLKCDAVPSIFDSFEETVETREKEENNIVIISDSNSPESVSNLPTEPIFPLHSTTLSRLARLSSANECLQCFEKSDQIEKLQEKLGILRRKLNAANKKLYYLEAIKEKLANSLADLKSQHIIDSKLIQTLKVNN